MTTEKTKDELLQEIGASAMASIAEMVAALTVDRDRLQELRDDREALEGADDAATEELRKDWDDDNGEELKELEEAVTIDGDEVDEEQARERIQEHPLCVQVRGDWHDVGADDDGAAEYEILLSTGGPATRIIGELNEHHEPTSARLQAQDWFTQWTEYMQADREILLTYVRCFYFGD